MTPMSATEDDRLIESYLEPDRAGPGSEMLSEWLDYPMLATCLRHGGDKAEAIRQKIKNLVAEMARHKRDNVPFLVVTGDRELHLTAMDTLKAIGADKKLKVTDRLQALELVMENL